MSLILRLITSKFPGLSSYHLTIYWILFSHQILSPSLPSFKDYSPKAQCLTIPTSLGSFRYPYLIPNPILLFPSLSSFRALPIPCFFILPFYSLFIFDFHHLLTFFHFPPPTLYGGCLALHPNLFSLG